MKKNRQKTNHRTRSLQVKDLAAVRGGDGGVIHANAIVGGGKIIADDNGVLHMQ